MADQADVYIKNALTEAIYAVRYLSGVSSDLDITIASGDEEKILLPGTDVYLVITAPRGIDIKESSILVKSDMDLEVSCSRTNSNWKIQIMPNSLPPEVPTTVNITVGGLPW